MTKKPKHVGYIQDGLFICYACTNTDKVYGDLYDINIAPYTQYCEKCGAILYTGQVATLLFRRKD